VQICDPAELGLRDVSTIASRLDPATRERLLGRLDGASWTVTTLGGLIEPAVRRRLFG
jgi:hypothetical protein